MRLVIKTEDKEFLKRLEKEAFPSLPEGERQRFEASGIRNKKGQVDARALQTAVAITNKFYIYNDKTSEKIPCYWVKGESIGDPSGQRDIVTRLIKYYFRRSTALGVEFIGGKPMDGELRRMLSIHPQNEANKGKWFHVAPQSRQYSFKEYNREKIATGELELFEAQNKARKGVESMTDEEIRNTCSALFPERWRTMSPNAMKLSLYKIADSDPKRLLTTTKGTQAHTIGLIERALKAGVINKGKNSVKWSNSELIKSFSTANGTIDVQFADFLLGESETLERIELELISATKEK